MRHAQGIEMRFCPSKLTNCSKNQVNTSFGFNGETSFDRETGASWMANGRLEIDGMPHQWARLQ